MEAIKLCRLDTPIIFIEARINLSRFVVTGCAAKTSATVTFPSLNLISLFAFCFNIWLNLVHQQTQNQRYGSSHIGATAKDISNVVTDAASGVVDIFHGIDKAVADTWNNFWKDGKA